MSLTLRGANGSRVKVSVRVRVRVKVRGGFRVGVGVRVRVVLLNAHSDTTASPFGGALSGKRLVDTNHEILDLALAHQNVLPLLVIVVFLAALVLFVAAVGRAVVSAPLCVCRLVLLLVVLVVDAVVEILRYPTLVIFFLEHATNKTQVHLLRLFIKRPVLVQVIRFLRGQR